jgi:NhaP-type Na+/H+ and K+/H+ antiporter
MNRNSSPALNTSVTTRLGAFTLAALITSGVLMGLGGTADQQYDQAQLAQSRVCTPQLASASSLKSVG